MANILVDTNIIIDYLRQKNKSKSIFFKIFSQKENKAFVALVTVAELWAGKSAAQKKTSQLLEKIINGCQVLIPSLNTAKKTGELLRQTNYNLSYQDAQIAALSLENKLEVLTFNQKDFKKVKKVRLYTL
ncbi:MAG: PIN domain-containing protein [Candidatus Shapirobacteria bacterium]